MCGENCKTADITNILNLSAHHTAIIADSFMRRNQPQKQQQFLFFLIFFFFPAPTLLQPKPVKHCLAISMPCTLPSPPTRHIAAVVKVSDAHARTVKINTDRRKKLEGSR